LKPPTFSQLSGEYPTPEGSSDGFSAAVPGIRLGKGFAYTEQHDDF
jgi:hypothetical protein